MSSLQRKVDLLVSLVMAEDDATRERAMKALRVAVRHSIPEMDKADMMKTEVQSLLQEIGVPCHLKGYYCLTCAACKMAENPDLRHAITSELYPGVAEELGDTATRVERAIRTAIEAAWDRGDPEILHEYFGYTISDVKGKPTNSEFICRVALEIRRRIDY